MKRSNKRRLRRDEAAIICFGVALFSLMVGTGVTSTYAWFEVSNQLQASNLALKFDTHDDFVLGLKDKKNNDTLVNAVSFNNSSLKSLGYNPSPEFDPVSSMWSSLWRGDGTYSDSITPTLRMAYTENGNTTKSEPAEGGFLQFEFYLQSTNDCYIFLDSATSIKANKSRNEAVANAYNQKKAASSLPVTASELDKIEDTVRISFYSDMGYYVYEPNVTTSSSTKFYGPLNVSGADDYYDYKGDTETFYGEYSGADLVYDPIHDDDTKPYDDVDSAFHALHKGGTRSVNVEASKEAGVSFASEKTYTLDEFILPTSASSVDLTKNADGSTSYFAEGKEVHPLAAIKSNPVVDSSGNEVYVSEKKRVVVSIYVEGWDDDMTDAVGAGCFNLNLSFVGINQPID